MRPVFKRAGGLTLVLIALTVVAACLGYVRAFRSHTYRYRMTVEVETPSGTRTGSAVRELTWRPTAQSFTGNRFTTRQRGEAVAVDLPDGRTLFALLDVDGHSTVAAGFGPVSTLELEELLDRVVVTREVHTYPARERLRASGLDYPPLVRFRDEDDPLTVEIVDPEDLETSFGPGVRLGQVSLQMTDDPVTEAIVNRLEWLGPHAEPRLDPNFRRGIDPGPAQRLSHGDFRRGH